LDIGSLTAALPGDSKLLAKGIVSTAAAKEPQLDLRVQLESADPLVLLKALSPQTETTSFPENIKVAFDVRGPWSRPSAPNLSLTLDGVEAKGQVVRTPEGIFDVRLTTDLLDIGPYLQASKAPEWLWGLPAFKATLLARNLRAGQLSAENVVADVSADGRVLYLNQINLRLLDGTNTTMNGSIAKDKVAPFNFRIRLNTNDFASLSRDVPQAALLLPFGAAKNLPGNITLESEWKSDATSISQQSSLLLPGGQVDVRVSSQGNDPLEWKLRVRHQNTAEFFKYFSLPALSLSTEAMDLAAEGAVPSAGIWSIAAAKGNVAGLTINDGVLTLTQNPLWQWEGSLSLGHVDGATLLASLNTSALTPVLARLSLQAESLALGEEHIENPSATLRLANSEAELSGLTGAWRQGVVRFSGSANLHNPDIPTYKMDMSLDGVKLSVRGGSRFGLAGDLGLQIQLESQGLTLADMRSNLSGNGEFSMSSGRFAGLDFSGLEAQLTEVKPSTAAKLPALLARSGQNELMNFGGNFVVESGVITAPRTRLRTTNGLLEGNMVIDLRAPRLDAQTTLSIAGAESLPPIGMNISGPLNGLGATFDVEALELALAPPPAPPSSPEPNKGEAEEKKPEPLPTTVTTAPTNPKTTDVDIRAIFNKKSASEGPAKESQAKPGLEAQRNANEEDVAPEPTVAPTTKTKRSSATPVIQPPRVPDELDGVGMRVITLNPPPQQGSTEPTGGPAPETLPETTAVPMPATMANSPPPAKTVTLPPATGSDERSSADAPPSLDDLLGQVRP
jgi:hypothetical protein